MNENNISKLCQVTASQHGAVTFRNNTGQAWQGTRLPSGGGMVILQEARPLYAGLCVGSSDLIGWKSIEITPEMVGKKVAVFVAIEVKGPRGRITEEQLNFLQRVQQAGGRAGVARSPEDVTTILNY